MEAELSLSPLLPVSIVAIVAGFAAAAAAIALWRGLSGWWLRALAAGVLVVSLIEPVLRQEEHEDLSDVVFLVHDQTESQAIADRLQQSAVALAELSEELSAMESDGVETVRVDVRNNPGDSDSGSMVLSALAAAAADVAPDRIAGAIIVSDGQVHDGGVLDDFPAPVHLVLSGRADEWDRRVVVRRAPSFAIVDEEFRLAFRIEDKGEVPAGISGAAEVTISINGGDSRRARVPVGQEVELSVTLSRGGLNHLQVEVTPEDGELTDRNNVSVITVNGVRDRLRVLLVSGLPYAGERSWRNLLKSDGSVDLVHFTILRPPTKTDSVPVQELALIEFPVRELFLNKIDEFDLIIFDRYEIRGILPGIYLANVVEYVRGGGALLVAAGPAMAGPGGLYRTALSEVLPARPTGKLVQRAYLPEVTDLGSIHPVTEDLASVPARGLNGPDDPGDGKVWGSWYRLVEAIAEHGQTIMNGPDARPLLILDRFGQGRIAMLLSDQAWLWTRGHDGGGPQLELLRRLAHWAMKEPELEEERLEADSSGSGLVVTRRTMTDRVPRLSITTPGGERIESDMEPVSRGRWRAGIEGLESGVHVLREGDLVRVAVVGSPAPREFENPLATSALLSGLVKSTGGAVVRLDQDKTPDIRHVREGRVAAGRDWVGVIRRDAVLVTDVRQQPLFPSWLLLLAALATCVAAWRLEGR